MHPKNPFSKPYDFEKLIAYHDELAPYVFTNKYGTRTIKFSDNKAVVALNTAILKTHYDVNWSIPNGSLCPPVPGRLDYLLQMSELISATNNIKLLDIGTGANLIYPILASCHLGWICTASEVNDSSFQHAQNLINTNPKLNNIILRKQKYKTKILEGIIQADDKYDLLVCNPPFYKNRFEAEKANNTKNRKLKLSANKNFGGQSTELWYKGGEVRFLRTMIAESSSFRTQVHWFSSLVSKKENLKAVKRAINKTIPAEVKVIEMEIGNKKSRIVAWTFQ